MINTTFKRSLRTLIAGLVLSATATLAQAESYPSRPMTMVIPFPAGGVTDTLGRATARQLGEVLGANVVVTNKQGGAGTIGMAQIAKSKADGYTVAVVPAAPLVNQPNLRRLPYDADSFDYICQLFSSPLVLATKPDSPFRTLNEVVDYARAHPGELSYGTPGPGTLPHLAMEQLLDVLDLQLRHVPFTGDAPGVTALMGGHIDLYLATGTVVSEKELPAVAAFADSRIEGLPDLATATEQGYELNADLWGGLIAPRGLAPEHKARLAEACHTVAVSEAFRAQLKSLGTNVAYRDAEAFQDYVHTMSATNARLINKLGLAQ
ncbi:Bug family tripartite tricarboxylate transporter substrate binding protein [Marinobacterium sedimentorum]|uniref:Bug family tripartite tricarboxylate transporter substrate binding protein n=1 Tax=Marinobacterium sedimentorum TaxID=2927804 RepID=UPI0020C705C5|nr:tripartite tricarboxylate transporter substrate binding protein [Marinobacterium sedimentorum]MCP8689512.1 tripartite tricarboxylate transporter substrate binding protein [Marinobacterium sedimentorum]